MDAHWSDVFSIEQQGMTQPVYALAVFDDELYAGGRFWVAGHGVHANYVARWDGREWHPLGLGVEWGPCEDVNCFAQVRDLVAWNGNLVVGGKFHFAGGTPANHIARWDGTNWYALGTGMNGEWGVYSLGTYQGNLIASGLFTEAGGRPVSYIAQWNGVTWQPLGPGLSGHANKLIQYRGDLIASGTFGWAGSVPVKFIARWDGNEWSALGSEIAHDRTGLLVVEDRLLAVTQSSLGDYQYLSRWDGATWEHVIESAGAEAFVEYNHTVVAGNPGIPQEIGRLNGGSWEPLGSGVGNIFVYPPLIRDIVVHGTSLYVCGDFTSAGGKPSWYIARWDDVITPVTLEDFTAGSTPDGVHLNWRLPVDSGSDLQSVSVQRAEAAAGPYVDLTPSRLAPEPVMTFLDSSILPGHKYWYRLLFALQDGGEETSRSLEVLVPEATGRAAYLYPPLESNGRPVELKFKLVGVSAPVRLAIYDVRGRIVRILAPGIEGPGEHSLTWDRLTGSGVAVSRGLYLVRLQVLGVREDTKRLLLTHN